jgi:hypothetical protein
MIRVFVGCAPNGEDAESQAVLEYTLRRHASLPIEITWMKLSRDPASPFYSNGRMGWQTSSWSTPFTGFRFLVPSLCAFEGRAIYTDSDVIFMADIAELWGQELQPGKCVKAKTEGNPKRLCISLWDCAAAKPYMPVKRDADALNFIRARLGSARAIQAFEGNWNCIDGEDYADLYDADIKVIHYSLESAQPHLRYAVPRLEKAGSKHWFDGKMRPHWRGDLVQLFDRCYGEAIAAGYPPERYIPEHPFGEYQIKSHENYGGHQWTK